MYRTGIYHLKYLFNPFDPGYQGCEKKKKKNPIMTQKITIFLRRCLISQVKRQVVLITTRKTSTLYNVPLLKNSRKNPKITIFQKNTILCIFSATVHCKELRFFALFSVRPGASFELSNSPLQRFFF